MKREIVGIWVWFAVWLDQIQSIASKEIAYDLMNVYVAWFYFNYWSQ